MPCTQPMYKVTSMWRLAQGVLHALKSSAATAATRSYLAAGSVHVPTKCTAGYKGLLPRLSVPGGAAKGHVGAAATILWGLQHILVRGDLGSGEVGSGGRRERGQQATNGSSGHSNQGGWP
jgi:hypothetical protein